MKPKSKSYHYLSITVLTVLLVLIVVGNILYKDFDNLIFLQVIDSYLKIILSSWPAAILLIGLFLLSGHKDAIDYFIKNRMTGVGFDGVKGDVITGSASEAEVKEKNIKDSKEEEEISANAEVPGILQIEEGHTKPAPGTIKPGVYERFKKIGEIEDKMQTILISNFPNRYKTHVKLSLQSSRSIVLDGLFTASDGTLRAVEIKYIAEKKSTIILKYGFHRLLDRLQDFGIKKMVAIIIADDLSADEAVLIDESIKLRISRYYFSLQGNDLVEIPLPPKMKKLLST